MCTVFLSYLIYKIIFSIFSFLWPMRVTITSNTANGFRESKQQFFINYPSITACS